MERRIREAALDLFRERGYEATTVEEIAERADVAKGTFFNYFPRKDALLEALADAVVEELFEELGPIENWTGTARDQLQRLFLRIGELVAEDPELSKIMLIEKMRGFWMRHGSHPLEEEFDEMIRDVLARGAERGELVSGVDIALGAKLIRAVHFTTMIEWLKAGAPQGAYRTELTGKFDIVFGGLGRTETAGPWKG